MSLLRRAKNAKIIADIYRSWYITYLLTNDVLEHPCTKVQPWLYLLKPLCVEKVVIHLLVDLRSSLEKTVVGISHSWGRMSLSQNSSVGHSHVNTQADFFIFLWNDYQWRYPWSRTVNLFNNSFLSSYASTFYAGEMVFGVLVERLV